MLVEMELEAMCRVCLKKRKGKVKLKSIFSLVKKEGGHVVRCPDMLMQCASVTVKENDGFPSNICDNCYGQLWMAYKFRILCEKTFCYLKECLLEKKSEIHVKNERSEDVCSDYTNLFDKNDQCLNVILLGDVKIETEKRDSDVVEVPNLLDIKDETNYLDKIENYDDGGSFNDKDIEFQDNENSINDQTEIQVQKDDKPDVSKESERKKVEGKWKCDQCPKTYKYMYQLLSHENSHFGLKPYFCDICQKSYSSEKVHVRRHENAIKYKCDMCTKAFPSKSGVTAHILTHKNNRKQFVCGRDGCTRSYLSMTGLTNHRLNHDGIKDVVCHICSKEFYLKSSLESHLKSHSDVKNCVCSYCGKRFKTTQQKSLHEMRHTNSKTYKCSYCEQMFYCSSSRKRHMATHTKLLKEECRFCNKKFARRDNRRRHEAVMHKVSENSNSLIKEQYQKQFTNKKILQGMKS